MTKIRSLALAFVAVMLLPLLGQLPPALADETDPTDGNLLQNPSFEEGTAPSSLAHWSPWTASSARFFTTATDPVSEGNQSLRLLDESDATGGGLLSDTFAVSPETVYAVSMDAFIHTGKFSVIMYFYDAAGDTLSDKQQAAAVEPGEWQRLTQEFYAPAGAATAAVMLYSSVKGTGDVHLDNVDVRFATQEPGPGTGDPMVDEILAQDPNLLHLGQPVQTRAPSMPAVGQEDGRWVSYQVFKGQPNTDFPGTLTVTDIETGELLRTRQLRTAESAYHIVVSTTGLVYITTSGDQHLWAYNPQTHQVRDIGKVGTSTGNFGLAAGADGRMYIGTYPEARVYEYDPTTDMITDLGRASTTELYARSLAYDPETDSLFVGVGGQKASLWKWSEGGHGALTRLTDETNAPGLEAETFFTDLGFVSGRIFARTKNVALVVVQPDGTVDYWNQGEKAVYGYRWFADPTDPNRVLHGFANNLYYYDITTRTRAVAFDGVAGYLGDLAWVEVGGDDPRWPGLTLYGTDVDGVVRINLTTGAKEAHEVGFAQPNTIQGVYRGPDNTMWASGFGTGLARVSLDGSTQYPSLAAGQYESAIVRQGELYLGAYGNARFSKLDLANPTQVPPVIFDGQAEGQDRPMSMAYNPDLDQAYVGAIAGYGKDQGGLAVYDFASGTHEWFTTEIVTGQSIISVLYNPLDQLVYIGTTLDGGLGSVPNDQTEGRLIVWDPVTRTTVHDIVPVAGQEGITGLVVGPDQKVWGIAENMLFTFDPTTGTVDHTQRLAIPQYPDRTIWKWAQLMVSPIDNNVYGTVRNRFFRLDGQTKEFTTLLATTGKYAELDERGDVYFEGAVSHLFKYVVPQPITGVDAEQKCLAVKASLEGRALDLSALEGRRAPDRLVIQRVVDGVDRGRGADLEAAYC